MKVKKIVIAAPIYPPEIGGPAQYAFHLAEEFQRLGHQVRVVKFAEVRHWPTAFRHLIYFFKLLPAMAWGDWAVALDTFSAALPAVLAARLCNTKIIIRTGGDFLWEQYVERTGDLLLFRNFYQDSTARFNLKERLIFKLTKWTLKNASAVVFSTAWQRDIFTDAYDLDPGKNFIVENYYGRKIHTETPVNKVFVTGGRKIKLKNLERLMAAFSDASKTDQGISLAVLQEGYESFQNNLVNSYAVIVASISEISPNLILEAVKYGKPFIVTKENGLVDRLKDISLLVDPLDIQDIKEKVLFLANRDNYARARDNVIDFSFNHDWADIVREISDIFLRYD